MYINLFKKLQNIGVLKTTKDDNIITYKPNHESELNNQLNGIKKYVNEWELNLIVFKFESEIILIHYPLI